MKIEHGRVTKVKPSKESKGAQKVDTQAMKNVLLTKDSKLEIFSGSLVNLDWLVLSKGNM